MSFSSINRKVIEPSIIAQRKAKRSSENVWNYVTEINKQLTNNMIYTDDSIIVTGHFIIDTNIMEQIVELYSNAGWDISNVTYNQPVDNDPGSTEITFKVPVEP